jgi:hypothetical protein
MELQAPQELITEVEILSSVNAMHKLERETEDVERQRNPAHPAQCQLSPRYRSSQRFFVLQCKVPLSSSYCLLSTPGLVKVGQFRALQHTRLVLSKDILCGLGCY